MEELKEQITSWGFQGSQKETDSLLAVLVSNGMSYLQDLVGINSCSELEGGAHLPPACISFVNSIMSQQRIESKRACSQSSVVAMTMSAASSSRETDTSGAGPRAALKRLNLTESNRSDWVKRARSAALIGSIPRSHSSCISGMRSWAHFADKALGLKGREFPPPIDGILAWSTLFRSSGTFSNYLNYVKVGCQILELPCSVFSEHADEIRRAKAAIDKKRHFVPRQPLFIQAGLLERIASRAHNQSMAVYIHLFIFAYAFLLRLPSEAIPVRRAGVGFALANDCPGLLEISSSEIVLHLYRRKNKPGGSVLRRGCWCSSHPGICPLHVLGPFTQAHRPGQQLFPGITPSSAVNVLRAMLNSLQVKDAHLYRTHDLRRGHARDLQQSGSNLAEILRAGEWRSAAFLSYLDSNQLEDDAVQEVHDDDNMSEQQLEDQLAEFLDSSEEES